MAAAVLQVESQANITEVSQATWLALPATFAYHGAAADCSKSANRISCCFNTPFC
jgi:hypothetical protein